MSNSGFLFCHSGFEEISRGLEPRPQARKEAHDSSTAKHSKAKPSSGAGLLHIQAVPSKLVEGVSHPAAREIPQYPFRGTEYENAACLSLSDCCAHCAGMLADTDRRRISKVQPDFPDAGIAFDHLCCDSGGLAGQLIEFLCRFFGFAKKRKNGRTGVSQAYVTPITDPSIQEP
jgi:hypothetical protein